MLKLIEQRLVGEATDYERSILRHGAVWFFLVLASYYVLRPIREQISSTYGIRNLSWLFTATFFAMLIAIPAYSWLVGRFHRRKLVPSIYAFFIVSLLGFYAAMQYFEEADSRQVETPLVAVNEVGYRQGGNQGEFVELYDGGKGSVKLDGYSLVLFNSQMTAVSVFDLGGTTTDEKGYCVFNGSDAGGELLGFESNAADSASPPKDDRTAAFAVYVTSPEIKVGMRLMAEGLVDGIVVSTNAEAPAMGDGFGDRMQFGHWTQKGRASDDYSPSSVSRFPDGHGTLYFVTSSPGEGNSVPGTPKVWIARVLFIWISVYGLFIVSFFWSVVGDMLSTKQGRRIFGVMAGGGTVGGMVGSVLASSLVTRIGLDNLLLIPALFLLLGLGIYFSLERTYVRLAPNRSNEKSGQATGGNPFAGFTAVFRSRYLFAICIYGLLLATCGTTIYFQQSEIVRDALNSEESRTAYFANMNFYVSIVTLVFQFVIVGWMMRTVGLGWTLACLPLAYVVGISALALSPTILVLAIITVTGRSAEYGICNPAREVLFTAVKREERYKAKSFIDTVVRRGGDTMVGSAYRGLRETLGFGLGTLSWMVVPIAVVWTGVALFIGRENLRVVERAADAGEVSG